jgi:hypothetical protein
MFDTYAIMKWCLASKNDPVREYEVTEGYDMEDVTNVGSKVVRELKSPNTQDDTIRYDFLKTILSPFTGEVIDFNQIEGNFSLTLMFNTLIDMKFLIEINE